MSGAAKKSPLQNRGTADDRRATAGGARRNRSGFLGRHPSRRFLDVGAVACAMLLAAGLALTGLGYQFFWDDEANTALYARNLIELGRLTAWDGTNLIGYAQGGSLGEDLGKELRVPALPAYVAAAGMLVCGQTTFGGRVLFAIAGVGAIALLAIWLRRYFGRRFPVYLPAMILALSPAYLLYIRNCRYYALGVVFTLLLWIFWTPGRRWLVRVNRVDGRLVLRFVGASIAILLLLSTHYLNAAAALATLPLFFFDRRFRNRDQYALFSVIAGVTFIYGVWVLVTANPFAADYSATGRELVANDSASKLVSFVCRFATNLWWFLRDLGTHEFLPWCLVPLLGLPWLAPWLRPLRPMARRGAILMAIVLVYLLVSVVLLPGDMGKGPSAEIRYVVPLCAVGAAIGGLGLIVLWRFYAPLAVVAAMLLVGTNLLHLGFLTDRIDQTHSWFPPTCYRFLAEIGDREDAKRTNVEAMVRLLDKLPAGTTIRILPAYLTYPAMFYVPKLHYCDQLRESKSILPELRKELPDYLYSERAKPDIIIVPAPHLRQAWGELDMKYGPKSYTLKTTLEPFWDFTTKPELPWHFFTRPEDNWQRYVGMAVLARADSPIASDPALQDDPTDADALYRMGTAQTHAGMADEAIATLERALAIAPDHLAANLRLGNIRLELCDFAAAADHFRTMLKVNPYSIDAHINLGNALFRLGDLDLAHHEYREALRIDPESAKAYYNLGNLSMQMPGRLEEAMFNYKRAVRCDPTYAVAYVNWAAALMLDGKDDRAISHLREAIRIRPTLIPAHVTLGHALWRRGHNEEAIVEFETALERIPRDFALASQVKEAIEKCQRGERPHQE